MPPRARRLRADLKQAEANGDTLRAAELRQELDDLGSPPTPGPADVVPPFPGPAAGKDSPPRKPRGGGSKTQLATALRGRITAAGKTMEAAGTLKQDPNLAYDGRVIAGNASRLADALDLASKQNKELRRALESLTVSSVWGELAGAVAGVLVPILANHGMVPPDAAVFVGAEPPPPPKKPRAPKAAKKGKPSPGPTGDAVGDSQPGVPYAGPPIRLDDAEAIAAMSGALQVPDLPRE